MTTAVREQCINKLYELTKRSKVTKPKETATNIEEAIFQYMLKRVEDEGMVYDWNDKKIRKMYRDKLLSIYYNLAHTKSFMRRLKLGEITPQQMVTMSPQEVAPEVWESIIQRRQHEEELIENATEGMISTMEECGKCHHPDKRCRVHSMQTRSADEGTTIFYKCCNCGHSWKQ